MQPACNPKGFRNSESDKSLRRRAFLIAVEVHTQPIANAAAFIEVFFRELNSQIAA
jgi:hypothetical protein